MSQSCNLQFVGQFGGCRAPKKRCHREPALLPGVAIPHGGAMQKTVDYASLDRKIYIPHNTGSPENFGDCHASVRTGSQ